MSTRILAYNQPSWHFDSRLITETRDMKRCDMAVEVAALDTKACTHFPALSVISWWLKRRRRPLACVGSLNPVAFRSNLNYLYPRSISSFAETSSLILSNSTTWTTYTNSMPDQDAPFKTYLLSFSSWSWITSLLQHNSTSLALANNLQLPLEVSSNVIRIRTQTITLHLIWIHLPSHSCCVAHLGKEIPYRLGTCDPSKSGEIE